MKKHIGTVLAGPMAARSGSGGAVKTLPVHNHSPHLSGDTIPGVPERAFDLTRQQMLFWLGETVGSGGTEFQRGGITIIPAFIDADAMVQAFSKLVEQADVLRSFFVERDGQPRQVIRDEDDYE